MIYTLTISQVGSPIFSHDILLEPGFSFEEQVTDALRVFEIGFPHVILGYNGVALWITHNDDACAV